jgi:hypothetical protein
MLVCMFTYVYVYICIITTCPSYDGKNHNIHALFHGLFHRPFMYSYMNPPLISSVGMLSSDCAVLCCVLDVQLFLQPQSVPHSEVVLFKL